LQVIEEKGVGLFRFTGGQGMQKGKIRVGFVGFGEGNTPREIIERKCRDAEALLEAGELLEVFQTAPVSDDAAGKDVERAVKELSAANFDLLIVCLAGWIPSHAVISVADAFKHKPMVLWGLSGWKENDRFVTTAGQAGTTALRKTFQDLGYRFKYVVNYLDAAPAVEKIIRFAQAANAASRLRGTRIGMMGWRDMNLYATLHDGNSLRSKIGPEIEFFEMLEMAQAMEKLEQKDIDEQVNRILKAWKFEKPADDKLLKKAAALYLAIKSKVRERRYEGVSLMDVDGVKKLMQFTPAPVFMMLADQENICTIPENDALGAVTQLMTRFLTGQIGAYLEFYDFTQIGALMGVPDYVPAEVVDGPVTVTPTAFGNLSSGLLNVSKLKTGKITLCRLAYTGDQYRLHLVTGTAKRPPKWEEAGWAHPAPQLPSLEIACDGPVDDFVQNVMGQHYIISYGDHAGSFEDLCALLGVNVIC
jgi:L-fucose isomerase-like protein